MSFLLAMSSLFPEFKVHTETLCGNLHLKQFQRDRYQFTSISCFCSDFNLGTRHTTCVVLLSLLCVIPVSLFFFQCCCFLSFWVSSRIQQSPQTTQPYFLNPRSAVLSRANYHVVNQSDFFFLAYTKLSSPFFFLGFRAGGLPAAALLFLPSLSHSSPVTEQTQPSEHRAE